MKFLNNKMMNKLILCILCGIFFISVWKIFKIGQEYKMAQDSYEKIKTKVEKEQTEEALKLEQSDKTNIVEFPTYEEKTGSIQINGVSLKMLLGKKYEIDFESLIELNKEVKAWIIIENTNINYPVVQASDNEKYLRQTLEGEWNNAGSIFIDCRNKQPFKEKNTIIHGHNQRNHMMFHDLVNYKEERYWKEHPYIQILMPNGESYLYYIYAYYITQEISKTYFVEFSSQQQYKQYLDYIEQNNVYNTDITIKNTDRIITLSTCTNSWNEERVVVHGVLINS